jgi:hypothetical protein
MRALIALVLYISGISEYVSQIWGWSVHSQESGDLQIVRYSFINSVATFLMFKLLLLCCQCILVEIK